MFTISLWSCLLRYGQGVELARLRTKFPRYQWALLPYLLCDAPAALAATLTDRATRLPNALAGHLRSPPSVLFVESQCGFQVTST